MLRLPMLIAVLLVAACQQKEQPAISIEQAKQVTSEYSGKVGFVAPPRSTRDILAVLDAERPNAGSVATMKRVADAADPTDTADAKATAIFYQRRAEAANSLGRTLQALADMRSAYQHAQPIKTTERDLYASILLGLANVERVAGNYESAKAAWQERISTSPAIGYVRLAYNILAALEAQSGDMPAARDYLDRAERLHAQMMAGREAGMWGPIWSKDMETARAQVAIAAGQYGDAEQRLRSAIVLSSTSMAKWNDLPAHQRSPFGSYQAEYDNLTRMLAEVLTQQGRLVEAEVEARRALSARLKAVGKAHPSTAFVLDTLSSILIEQGRYAEAQKIAEQGIEALRLAGVPDTSRYMGRQMVTLASSLLAQRRYTDALSIFDRLAENFASDEGARRMFLLGSPDVGMARLKAGQYAAAKATLDAIYDDIRGRLGERHRNTAEVRGLRAVAMAKTNDPAALGEFRESASVLLSSSRQVDDDITPAAIRDQRMRTILESYMTALAARGNAADEAFRVADAIRGQAVQRAIAASSARARTNDPALADLVRREQDAKAQIGALFGLLVNIQNSAPDQRDTARITKVRTDIDNLRTARSALRMEIERRFPEYANLIDPRPAQLAQVRTVLRDGEALISIYTGEERSFVWAVQKTGDAAFVTSPMTEGNIDQIVAHLRRALDPNVDTLGQIPAFDLAQAHLLYKALIAPVESTLAGTNQWLVIPHGSLGQLPLSLLPTAPVAAKSDAVLFAEYKAVPWLARRAAVTQVPSVSALLALRSLPHGNANRQPFIGIGDPIFSVADQTTPVASAALNTRGRPLNRRNAPSANGVSSAELASLPRLADTADEVTSVAIALKADPAADVLIGRRATETAVKSGVLDNRKVVMFATHGLIPGDLNGLTQPALALTTPALADNNGDGLLTVDEILGLKLDADWVVLSACNTAAGDGAGAEAVSGLGRAFFYAGARALLVSNWPVETTSARLLTTDLFRRQADNPDLGRAEAARQAMLAMIDGPGVADEKGRPVFSYAHPIFWAPFSVVGDGGR